MDTAVIKTPSNAARTFLETTLGFGRPFNNEQLSSLFKGAAGSLRYTARDSTFQASINSVNEIDWNAMHFNEKGTVLHDIAVDPINRIDKYVRKELHKHGFMLVDATSHKETAVLLNSFNTHLTDFLAQYGDDTTVRSTVTMRDSDVSMNWDLTVRIFIQREDETIFISLIIPRIVRTISPYIEQYQIQATVNAVRQYLEGFAPYIKLLMPLTQLDIVVLLVHRVMQTRVVKEKDADKLYTEYRKSVISNQALFQSNTATYPLLNYVMETAELASDGVHRTILLGAMELALQQLEAYLKFNKTMAIAA